MLKQVAVGTAVAACAALALQIQVTAQQNTAQQPQQRRAVGGTTAGNDAYPTDEQYRNSKEAQALVEELKSKVSVPSIPIYELPPAIVVHAGPRAMGVGFFVE